MSVHWTVPRATTQCSCTLSGQAVCNRPARTHARSAQAAGGTSLIVGIACHFVDAVVSQRKVYVHGPDALPGPVEDRPLNPATIERLLRGGGARSPG
jgi:hypothetical protein